MELILSIAGGLILILLGIIGYFIARNYRLQENTNKELNKSINKLSDSITGLNGVVLRFEERHKALEKRYDEHLKLHHDAASRG